MRRAVVASCCPPRGSVRSLTFAQKLNTTTFGSGRTAETERTAGTAETGKDGGNGKDGKDGKDGGGRTDGVVVVHLSKA